jgi:hypothetical protein
MWGTLSDERMGLSFKIAAGPRQRSHSRVPVSRSRLSQPGGTGPCIYIPQALGSLFVAFYETQGYGGGIRSRLHRGWCPRYITPLHGPHRKHRFQQFLYCCMHIRCRGNVFIEPCPCSGRPFLLIKKSLLLSSKCFAVFRGRYPATVLHATILLTGRLFESLMWFP